MESLTPARPGALEKRCGSSPDPRPPEHEAEQGPRASRFSGFRVWGLGGDRFTNKALPVEGPFCYRQLLIVYTLNPNSMKLETPADCYTLRVRVPNYHILSEIVTYITTIRNPST